MDALEGCGQEPTQEELAPLVWPLCRWWEDRDRIVLMYEYISTMDSPDGSFDWERGVCSRAVELWSEGREGSATLTEDRRDSSSQRWENRMGWNEFGRDKRQDGACSARCHRVPTITCDSPCLAICSHCNTQNRCWQVRCQECPDTPNTDGSGSSL